MSGCDLRQQGPTKKASRIATSIRVLDFGLAKVGGTPAADPEHSPTMSLGMTEAGVILGTAVARPGPSWIRGRRVCSGVAQMAVDVTTDKAFQAGVPRRLFTVPPINVAPDVSADGKRFLYGAIGGSGTTAQTPFTVVLNWQAALKK